uniref:Uncharacterized protein n=1 Tax=Rhizophora mucronata TaxID=61149 RepID=A0A2P2MPK3_RHIMU
MVGKGLFSLLYFSSEALKFNIPIDRQGESTYQKHPSGRPKVILFLVREYRIIVT